MKRCPTCQKTFADSMKFCQTDGTPLVEDQESAPQSDPYKTVVGSITDDDLLQIPDAFDPMKTMVTSDVPKAEDKPKDSAPKDSSSESSSKSEAATVISPSKPLDSSLNAPSFGDLSSSSSKSSESTSGEVSKPSKPFDATFSAIDPPAFGTPKKGDTAPFNKPSDAPFGSAPKDSSPFGNPPKDESPFGSSTKDDAPPTAFGGTPFDVPKSSSVPPPYKEPSNQGGQSPFGQQSSDPWGTPQTPFGGQSNDPFGSPQFGGQGDWTPPPAPVSNWQDQGVGANTPFQPPMGGTGGQDQTLAIVSLVCGILSLCACGILTGIPALITDYMAKNNVDSNPAQYGGRGMATAGMILGGISVVFTVLYLIFVIISAVAR